MHELRTPMPPCLRVGVPAGASGVRSSALRVRIAQVSAHFLLKFRHFLDENENDYHLHLLPRASCAGGAQGTPRAVRRTAWESAA